MREGGGCEARAVSGEREEKSKERDKELRDGTAEVEEWKGLRVEEAKD